MQGSSSSEQNEKCGLVAHPDEGPPIGSISDAASWTTLAGRATTGRLVNFILGRWGLVIGTEVSALLLHRLLPGRVSGSDPCLSEASSGRWALAPDAPRAHHL